MSLKAKYSLFSPLIKLLTLFLLVAAVSSCREQKKPDPSKLQEVGMSHDDIMQNEHSKLSVHLSSPNDRLLNVEELVKQESKTVKGTTLSKNDFSEMLARMKKMEPAADKDFAVRPSSTLPPQVTEIINKSFPPKDDQALKPTISTTDEPLKIERVIPSDTTIDPGQLSVTFNKSMVALSTIQQTESAKVPIEIDPQPAGKWEWLGTKTALFVPQDHLFPFSTKYNITIKKGTKAEDGSSLAEEAKFQFQTPTLKAGLVWPLGRQASLRTPVVLSFNQEINTTKITPVIRLKISRGYLDFTATTVVTPDILTRVIPENRDLFQSAINNLKDGHYIILLPKEKIDADSKVEVTLLEGAPSVEGPLKTEKPQTFDFRTISDFRVKRVSCGYVKGKCEIFDDIYISFTTTLSKKFFNKSFIYTKPAIENMKIDVMGDGVRISGVKKPNTDYNIIVKRDLKDLYGQELVGENSFNIETKKQKPLFIDDHNYSSINNPFEKPIYAVKTLGVKKVHFIIWKVANKDILKYNFSDFIIQTKLNKLSQFRFDSDDKKNSSKPLPKPLFDKDVHVQGDSDKFNITSVDLSSYLTNGHGTFAILSYVDDLIETYGGYNFSFLTFTDLGVDFFTDNDNIYAWVNNLKTGEPIQGASVSYDSLNQITDKNGISVFSKKDIVSIQSTKLKNDIDKIREICFSVEKDNDSYCFNPDNIGYSNHQSSYKWVILDDRHTYRPGEKIAIKGWLRKVIYSPAGGITYVNNPKNPAESYSFKIEDSNQNILAEDTLSLDKFGAFSLQLTLPSTPHLGNANLIITTTLASGKKLTERHSFSIEEFRTPEYEVNIEKPKTPQFQNVDTLLTAHASYYSGGPLANAKSTWSVNISHANYTPPGNDEYIFGKQYFWWWHLPLDKDNTETQIFKGKTDDLGEHLLNVKVDQQKGPMVVSAKVSVEDVNRQSWSDSVSYISHAANRYVGLHTDGYFLQANQPTDIRFVVTDIAGNQIPDVEIEIVAERIQFSMYFDEEQETRDEKHTCQATSKTGGASCSITLEKSGTYEISAEVTDSEGRTNRTSFRRWVYGGVPDTSESVSSDKMTLVPDKEFYNPGDTAKIMVQSPFSSAYGIYTLGRAGVAEKHFFKLNSPMQIIEIPLKKEYLPGVVLRVKLLSSTDVTDISGTKKLGLRPAFAEEVLDLKISRASKTLTLNVEPKPAFVKPGEKSEVSIQVTDPTGASVPNTQVAFFAVDDAILALSNKPISDIVAEFYPYRPESIETQASRSDVRVSKSDNELDIEKNVSFRSLDAVNYEAPMDENELAKGGGVRSMMRSTSTPMPMMANAPTHKPIPFKIRSDFNPLAKFVADAVTDANGKVKVNIDLPDNLTRYRLLAVAASSGGDRFGYATSSLTARLPFNLRPSAPRFLNFGDTFEVPVVLQNLTSEPLTVKLVARSNLIQFTENLASNPPNGISIAGVTVNIPAKDRVEVRFPAMAMRVGKATIDFAATGYTADNRLVADDAASVSLPVWTPVTSEGFATYGTIEQQPAVAQSVEIPTNVWPQFGDLSITTSSTIMSELTDSAFYLFNYRYLFCDGIASRIIGLLSLHDFLTDFKGQGLTSETDFKKEINTSIKDLIALQKSSGAFIQLPGAKDTFVWTSITAAHALIIAKQAGFDIPENALSKSTSYLHNVLQIIDQLPKKKYSKKDREELKAYALYVRAFNGEDVKKAAVALTNSIDISNSYDSTLAFLIDILPGKPTEEGGAGKDAQRLDSLLKIFKNRVVENADSATVTTSQEFDKAKNHFYHSNVNVNAQVLEALITKNPSSTLIPKLVRTILKLRNHGYWIMPSENARVLIAMKLYYMNFEKNTPSFSASSWFGDLFAGTSKFKGREAKMEVVKIPMNQVVTREGKPNIVLAKNGTGRMYYRLALDYAPKTTTIPMIDRGFTVQRKYRGIDHASDVQRDVNGSWNVRLGSRVEVIVTVVTPTYRGNTVLVDSLPAGFEVINANLAVADLPDTDPDSLLAHTYDNAFGYMPWRHVNLRNERVEAYASSMWGGVFTFHYYAKATTPGTFTVPPAKAEELQSPETFGRSDSVNVIIK